MVPPVAAQGYVVYAGQGCTTLAVSASQRAAGGRRERMCGWWKCAGSMFRMFRAKARPALCGSYGRACSGGRPARLLAAHVDLLAELVDDVAVSVDDVGLRPEARRGGNEGVSSCSLRGSAYPQQKKT